MLAIISYEDLKIALKDTGAILQYASLAFIIPVLWSLISFFFYKETIDSILYFGLVGILCHLFGYFLKTFFAAQKSAELKHGILVTGFVWLIFPLFASLPFYFLLGSSMIDSYFESMSAITTTGLTILQPVLDSGPSSVVLWRSFLGWIGGIGIIALSFIGVFMVFSQNKKLVIAEGRNERLTPGLKKSIVTIWKIYLGLTILGAALLWISGMTPFDSVNYSMSAISTNGMPTTSAGLSDEHMGWENIGNRNFWVDISLIVIMMFGATSFIVHYHFFSKNEWRSYINDPEFKTLLLTGIIGSLFVIPKLGVESSIFHIFSSLTTGGIALTSTADAIAWPEAAKFILVIAMIIGGASASTAGGLKLGRALLFIKSIWWKARETISSTNIFFPRKFAGKTVGSRELEELYGFILLYLFFGITSVFVLTFDGASVADSLFEVFSAQGNAGLSVGVTHTRMPIFSEIALIFSMWIGRLEILPFLALAGMAVSAVLPSRVRNA